MISRLALRTGSDPADVATARTFAAAIGRTVGLDDDSIDNLRMAVSEVASAVVELGLGPIDMNVEVGDGEMTVLTRLAAHDSRLEGRLVLVTRLPLGLAVQDGTVELTIPFVDRDA